MSETATPAHGGDVLQRQRLALLHFYQARAARRASSRAAANGKPSRNAGRQPDRRKP